MIPIKAPLLVLIGKQIPSINTPNIDPENIPLIDKVSWIIFPVWAAMNAITMKSVPQMSAAIKSNPYRYILPIKMKPL